MRWGGVAACDECGERPATIRYTEMVDGALSTWSLCDECAARRGVTGGLSSLAAPLVNILMGLLGDSADPAAPGEPGGGTTCPQCSMSYGEFRVAGRLGCGACYDTFKGELLPLIRRIHGSTEHVGRVPPGLPGDVESRREVRRLEAELERAVRQEEYERAAELRDLIRTRREDIARSGAEGVDVRDADD